MENGTQFTPGQEVEVKDHQVEVWRKGKFVGYTSEGIPVAEYKNGRVSTWNYIRPIPKPLTMEDELNKILHDWDTVTEEEKSNVAKLILDWYYLHSKKKPSDEEIRNYWLNTRGVLSDGVIETVRHFMNQNL